MTISSQSRKAGPFTGNGSTTAFPFAFKVFSASDAYVVRANTSGVETVLTMGTDYTVTLNSNQNSNPGGTVTLASALASNFKLVITSAVPNLQPVDITNNGAFYPKVINDALDRVTIMVQQNAQEAGRGIKVPITSSLTSDEFTDQLFGARDEAVSSAASAGTSASAAGASATSAASSAATATTKASEASTSASGAASSASAAAGSATAAAGSAMTAGNSATTATTKATEAASSATAAASSATAASGSATTATTKAGEASTSAAAAADSQTAAAASATSAGTSATNAASSATSASNSATTASGAASTATTKASEASASAATATTKASEATTSASSASTSATNAAGSATSAASSATNAATSADSAKRYQGPSESNPTTRLDGSPIQIGDTYFNTVALENRVYNGTFWQAQAASPDTMSERSFLATAGQTSYTFTGGYRVGYTYVWVNGALLYPADFTATDGTTITFANALALNDEVRILSIKAVGSVAVADISGLQTALDAKITKPTAGDGTAAQVLTSQGPGLPPLWSAPPAGAGAFTAVASGSLTTGQTVVLNTDGTVTAVSGYDSSAGTPVTVDPILSNFNGCTYDPVSGKIIFAFVEGGNSYACVGTVSGSTISFGTLVSFALNSGYPMSLTYDTTNNKVVIAYTNWNGSMYAGYAIVGAVSGNSISFGSPVSFAANDTSWGVAVTFVGSGKVVAVSGASPGWASGGWVGTISGTSISFGPQWQFGGLSQVYVSSRSLSYDPINDRIVLIGNGSSFAYSLVASVIGTDIGWGSYSIIRSLSATAKASTSTFDASSGKTVVTYGDTSTTYVAVGTVSGTTLTLGAEKILPSGGATYVAPVYDSANSRIIFAYGSNGGSLKQCTGVVSGTNISVSASATILVGVINGYVSCTYSVASGKPVAFYTANGTAYQTAVVFQAGASNISAKPFVGFSAGNYSNGDVATVNSVGSTDSNQSGLNTGVAQYVQGAGGLGASPSPIATVYAGNSLSATKILVKG